MLVGVHSFATSMFPVYHLLVRRCETRKFTMKHQDLQRASYALLVLINGPKEILVTQLDTQQRADREPCWDYLELTWFRV